MWVLVRSDGVQRDSHEVARLYQESMRLTLWRPGVRIPGHERRDRSKLLVQLEHHHCHTRQQRDARRHVQPREQRRQPGRRRCAIARVLREGE